MSDDAPVQSFLWLMFLRLRRHLALDIRDYREMQRAVGVAFGWMSPQDLRDICCALWAKSLSEQHLVEVFFDQLVPKHWTWDLGAERVRAAHVREHGEFKGGANDEVSDAKTLEAEKPLYSAPAGIEVHPEGGLPELAMPETQLSDRPFVFVPQFPLTERDVIQAWRRLRHPIRTGPLVELDIEATITRRMRSGVASPAVLLPRRRYMARVLLLVDRQGSMAPFHHFVDEVVRAIEKASRLERVPVYYFRNLPAEGSDDSLLASLQSELFPVLDSVLPSIKATSHGIVFEDKDLLRPQKLHDVLKLHATGANVILISDGGAARRRYNVARLMNTIAFMKSLREYTTRYVWLNPLPRQYWANTTAGQIARHIPMFPLDRDGLYEAIAVMRNQRYNLEAPIQ